MSYAFLHGDIWHLVSNMLFLYIFGNNVNDKMGHVGYLAFYLGWGRDLGRRLHGDGAAGGRAAADRRRQRAVAAITGAYLVLLPYSTVTVFYMLFFIGTLELPGFVFVLLFFLKDLIGFSGNAGNVAYVAHLFGTLFGFAICLAAARDAPAPARPVRRARARVALEQARQYRDMVSKGYNPFDFAPVGGAAGARGGARPAARPAAQRAADLRSEIADLIARHDLPAAADKYVELRAARPGQVLARQARSTSPINSPGSSSSTTRPRRTSCS